MKIKKQLTTIAFIMLYSFVSYGQDFEKRYAFAKAYFGVDFNYVPSFGESYYLNSDNNLSSFTRNGFVTPSINLAASHFWGYSDIYVSIGLLNFKAQKDEIGNAMSLGAAAGFRVYPMPLKDNMVRPFVGYKFSPFTYTQRQLGNQLHSFSQSKSMFDCGLGYRTPSLYLYASYNMVLNPKFDTYVSRTQKAETKFPSQFFNLGVNWTVETTRGNNNTKTKQVHQLLDSTNTAGFFFGIGPSSVFPLVSSKYITETRPYLQDKSVVGVLPDMALGYHFTKQDFIVAMAFRPIKQNRSALNVDQTVKRNSLVLEGYKFLFDYHGFAPFIGGGASYENIKISETDNGQKVLDLTANKITPIATFGWDIRPSRKSDVWLLRTNLRYAPVLKSAVNNTTDLSLQHLEFNYIQFVMYPGRIKLYRR